MEETVEGVNSLYVLLFGKINENQIEMEGWGCEWNENNGITGCDCRYRPNRPANVDGWTKPLRDVVSDLDTDKTNRKTLSTLRHTGREQKTKE